MPKQVTYELVAEAANYCWSKNFLNVLRDFFAEHAYLFKDCVDDSPPSMEEQDLEQYSVFQRYLALYEQTLSGYIESLDVSVTDFFFQLEDVRNDKNLKDKKLKNFVNYLLASTDYPAFYKVMVRAAKKLYRDGVLIAESKLGGATGGEIKSPEGKGCKDDGDGDYETKRDYK